MEWRSATFRAFRIACALFWNNPVSSTSSGHTRLAPPPFLSTSARMLMESRPGSAGTARSGRARLCRSGVACHSFHR
eukprot:12194921-Alexandrium_andersonii.AAC.1